jgi:hypothetical protein
LCLLFNKIGERLEQVLPGSEGGGRERDGARGTMAQTMYAYMNILIKKMVVRSPITPGSDTHQS